MKRIGETVRKAPTLLRVKDIRSQPEKSRIFPTMSGILNPRILPFKSSGKLDFSNQSGYSKMSCKPLTLEEL
jgi:hypothetical protein